MLAPGADRVEGMYTTDSDEVIELVAFVAA